MPKYDRLPLFPLHAVLFPQMPLPLHIFEERYRLMIARCIDNGEAFGVVLLQQGREVSERDGAIPKLCSTGTTAHIVQSERFDDGRYFVSAQGETRFEIDEVYNEEPYLTAKTRPLWDSSDDPVALQGVYDQACGLFRSYIDVLLAQARRHLGSFQLPNDPEVLSYAIAASLQVTLADKQRLLEAPTAAERLRLEVEMLQVERQAQEFFISQGDTPPQTAPADADAAPGGDEPTESAREGGAERTILRVDPSYTQYYFSKN